MSHTATTQDPQAGKRAAVRAILGRAEAVLSPMAGVSDRAFRGVCREMGAGVTYCEFVSADGVLHGNPATFDLMEVGPEEHPVGIQLFGSNPDTLSEAARTAEKIGPDIIDLNFGCPVKKVVKRNGGSALLCNVPLMDAIVRAVVAATSLPVTAKIRLGWSAGSVNYGETTRMLEEAGAGAITIHGRTRDQGFKGVADWAPIAEVKATASVPIIGNGDVTDAAGFLRMKRETGCDAVMIARGAIGNPWIFAEIEAALAGKPWRPPTVAEILDTMVDHLDREVALKGERNGVKRMRRQMACYLKGFPGASELRQAVFREATRDGVAAAVRAISRRAAPSPGPVIRATPAPVAS
jgi:nifR3 family TIM-barrel protein